MTIVICASWDCRQMTDPVSNKLTHKEEAEYKVTLKGMTEEQLFETWHHEYDARHTAHVELIIAEMNTHNPTTEAIAL